MEDTSRLVFDAYMQEYGQLKDEIANRTTLQNNMCHRAISLSALTVTLLVGVFTFVMRDGQSGGTTAAVTPSLSPPKIDQFVCVCIVVLGAYELLIQLTIAAWIYQLSLMFQIVRYWNWFVESKLEPLTRTHDSLFLRLRKSDGAPWILDVDRGILKYFQVLFLYALSGVGLAGLLVVVVLKFKSDRQLDYPQVAGALGFLALVLTQVVCLVIHRRIVRDTEASKSAFCGRTPSVSNLATAHDCGPDSEDQDKEPG